MSGWSSTFFHPVAREEIMSSTPRFGSTITPDIDLDAEEVLLPDGRRLTNEVAEGIAERALEQHRRGRPSVTGRAETTPSLTVRVAPGTRAELERIAKAQGRRLADVSRDALEEYVARRPRAPWFAQTPTARSIGKAATARGRTQKAGAVKKTTSRKTSAEKKTTAKRTGAVKGTKRAH